MIWSADFETTTDVKDTRVWAWCACEVGNTENIHHGNTITTFLEFCELNGGEYYFHNLAFDGEFIIWELLDKGFTHEFSTKNKGFETVISKTGKYYEIKICFSKTGKKKANTIVLKDSLKKLPMGVGAISKAFKLPLSKLEIDYEEYRKPGHELTNEELEYITNDVKIVALALEQQFNKGLTRLTIGSDALNNYKDSMDDSWDKLFPLIHLEMDAEIRKAYRGGYTYADERHKGKMIGEGSVYDVNSLYPDVMYNRPLPIGKPVYYRGKYTPDKERPLYIQFFTCHAELKDGFLPTLQIKNNPFYSETEYVHTTDGTVELALSNVDMDIFFTHYDVTVFSYNGGYKFESKIGMFKNYIDYWMDIKENSEGGIRTLAKLMLNSLYGKFATNPDVTGKIPYLDEHKIVKYKVGEYETRKPVYTPLGVFVTSWARYKTITAAQQVYDRFLYADTDSIHLIGTQPVEGLEVHPTHLGAWKHESDFSKAKYVRAKTYMERITHVGKLENNIPVMVEVPPYDDVKCAGMPETLKKEVTFDNFKRGLKIYGKLRPKHCPGGIVLEKTTFTLT